MNQVKRRAVPPAQIRKVPEKVKRAPRRVQFIGDVLLLISSLVLAGFSYQAATTRYQQDMHLVREGMQHLSKIKVLLNAVVRNPFDTQAINQTQYEFSAALKSLTPVGNDLKGIPGVAQAFPVYGPRIHAAQHLVFLSLALSQAGIEGCDIMNLLISRLHSPLQSQANGITATDLAIVGQKLRTMQAASALATKELQQLSPSDMLSDTSLRRQVNALRIGLPMLQEWLARVGKILPAATVLLGIDTPANYLIEVLDSTELRPGGGFIGNYGVMTLAGGRLTGAHITDTDLLDHPFVASGLGIPFPPAYRWFDIARGNWGVRDSNLDADFPTAARDAESNYIREGGDVKFQGVVAITPALIQRTLTITGPIVVPEYHETINAQNLIERIHYYQLGHGARGADDVASPDGHSSLRKHFIALLSEHFLSRLCLVAPAHLSQFIQILSHAVQTKDLQIYVNDPTVEMLLHATHADASVQTPPGDDLFIVDANIAANKANSLITSAFTDVITLDSEGNALHHAELRYTWKMRGQTYGASLYRDYLRIYAPRGSVLQAQHGWEQRGAGKAFGHAVWAGFFTLQYGGSRTITLDWRVPHAAISGAQGWHYQEMLQKQAGTNRSFQVQVTLPPCALFTREVGGIDAVEGHTAVFQRLLTEDTSVAVDYAIHKHPSRSSGACPSRQSTSRMEELEVR